MTTTEQWQVQNYARFRDYCEYYDATWKIQSESSMKRSLKLRLKIGQV